MVCVLALLACLLGCWLLGAGAGAGLPACLLACLPACLPTCTGRGKAGAGAGADGWMAGRAAFWGSSLVLCLLAGTWTSTRMSASDAAAGASASTPADPCWPEPFREIRCHGHPGPELCCDENHGVDDNEEDDDASGESMQVMPGDQEDIGQVAVILRPLSGSNPIQAMVDPDATVGQLKAKLKKQLKSDEYYQYVQRGNSVARRATEVVVAAR